MRNLVIELLHTMGVSVQKDMHLPTCTHIVAKAVDDKSLKLERARECVCCLRSRGHATTDDAIMALAVAANEP